MKTALFRSRAPLALILGLGLALSAHAADTWTYTTTSNGAGVDTASSGATSLSTIGAYATNGAGTALSGGALNGISGNWSTNTSGSPSAALTFYDPGGLGMGSDGTGTPNHALDNNGTYTEAVLLTFGSSVMLTGIDLGYISGDADISIFRYNGASVPNATVNGVGGSLASMNSAGWQLVGNYANLTQDSTSPFKFNLVNGATDSDSGSGVTPTAGASSVGSSWWLITAYNSAYYSCGAMTATNCKTTQNNAGLTQGNDYFKLLAVAGTTCTGNTTKCGPNRTPEPGSLALASLALGGLFFSRRRNKIVAI